jgi:hypothetical protein
MRSFHPGVWAVAVVAALAALLGAGCATDDAAPARRVVPTANATLGEAYRDAELVSAQEQQRRTAQGVGESMAPLYGDGTVLVIHPIGYDDLAAGMLVAYLDRHGRRVVHKLVGRTAGGWLTIGLNNDRVDGDLVTPHNLLGVIYASFHFTPGQ